MRRFLRRPAQPPAEPAEPASVIAIDANALSRVFSAPVWLRDLGLLAWFLVGVILILVGIVWLAGTLQTIVGPVLAGAVIAAVAGPVVSWMQRHGVPRVLGAIVVLLGIIAIGVVIFLLVVGGISSQSSEIESSASDASNTIDSWLHHAGIDNTADLKSAIEKAVPDAGATLITGVIDGLRGLTSFAFFLAFTAFALFFLLKDGPMIRRWLDTHMGVPEAVATTVTRDVIVAIRGYFLGVTIVAAFNAVVIGLAAWLLGVPLAGTIAVVTFVTAYIPYIGAVISGAFAVLLALASGGTDTALVMLFVVIVANGTLQNIVQPFAFGATLEMNPLAVFIVTLSAGALFGMVGLVLGAPLTSAAVHISKDLARAKAAEAAKAEAAERAPPLSEPDLGGLEQT